jgi:hypothetical protein
MSDTATIRAPVRRHLWTRNGMRFAWSESRNIVEAAIRQTKEPAARDALNGGMRHDNSSQSAEASSGCGQSE